jgi:hypothetical protein
MTAHDDEVGGLGHVMVDMVDEALDFGHGYFYRWWI